MARGYQSGKTCIASVLAGPGRGPNGSVPSFARIGETMDEAVKRYGEVIRHGNIHGEELYSFKKNGFNILAHFHAGKIDRIMYSRESGSKLTDEEIDTFLKANNKGRPMNEDPSVSKKSALE